MMPVPRPAASRPRAVLAVLLCALALQARAAPEAEPGHATGGALLVRTPTKGLYLDLALAGSRCVAVGVHGLIVRSDDAGATWAQSPAPVDSMLTCISFSDAHSGWAAGHDGVILATADGGATWTRTSTPAGVDDSILDILALPDGRLYAVGAYGLFLASADRGTTWERRSALDEDLHLNRITAGPSGTLYLAAEAGTLATSTDRGATWTRIETPYEGSFFGFGELASGRLLAHGLRGHVYVSADDGATWAQSQIEHGGLIATSLQLPGGLIGVAGAGGEVFFSRDGGLTFTAGGPTGLTAVAEMIAVGPSIVCAGDSGLAALPSPQP